MDHLDLSPAAANVTIADTDGGAYYTWSDSTYPFLSQAMLGAGKLVLQPRGFALPHYADCDKIGFVVRGSFRVGIVFPNSTTEHVVTIKKGEVIAVHLGAVTWWYNGENTIAEIIFLGETSKTYTPAQFDYYFLTGSLGVLRGFSTDFISRALNLGQNEVEKLLNSQTGGLIVKLAEGQNLPEPNSSSYEAARNVDSLREFELSSRLEKVEANSILGPIATADSSYHIFYVLEGSGRVQVSGLNGKNELDAKLQKGDLFVVPRFFAAAIMADGEGLHCFSVLTSSQPTFLKFAGETSVWKALSPSVLSAAFNLNIDLAEELLKKKIGN